MIFTIEIALVIIIALLFYFFGKNSIFHIILNIFMYLFYAWLWFILVIPKDENELVRGDIGLGFAFLTFFTAPIYILINGISLYYFRKKNHLKIAKIHAIGLVLCLMHLLVFCYKIYF